jgi:hypothetical protein
MDRINYLLSDMPTLGKAGFTVKGFYGNSLPSVALGKGFAECKRHSAKRAPAVVFGVLYTPAPTFMLGVVSRFMFLGPK